MLCYKAWRKIWECMSSRRRRRHDGTLRRLSLLGLMHSPYRRHPWEEEVEVFPPCCERG